MEQLDRDDDAASKETMTSLLSVSTAALSDVDDTGPSKSDTPAKGFKKYRLAKSFMSMKSKKRKEEPITDTGEEQPLSKKSTGKKSKSYIRKLSDLGTSVAKNYKISPRNANIDKSSSKSSKKTTASDSSGSSKRRHSPDVLSTSQTSLLELDDDDPLVQKLNREKGKRKTRDLLKITISGKKKTTSSVPIIDQRKSGSGGGVDNQETVEIQTTCEVSNLTESENIVLHLRDKDDDNNSFSAGKLSSDSVQGETSALLPLNSGHSIVITTKPITDQISQYQPPPPSVISTRNRAPFSQESTGLDRSTASLTSLDSETISDNKKPVKRSIRNIFKKFNPDKSELKSAILTSSGSLMHLVKHPNSVENLDNPDLDKEPKDFIKIRSNFIVSNNNSMSSSKVESSSDQLPEENSIQPVPESQPQSLDDEIKEVISFDIGSEVRPPVTITSPPSPLNSDLSKSQRRISFEPVPGPSNREIEPEPSSTPSNISDFKSIESSELMSEMPAHGDLIFDDSNISGTMAAMPQGKKEHLYKILVIGELGTGKTSFIKRYVHQFFSNNYRATIGVDFALKVIPWDENTIVRLQLWDIAGQERFGNMTRVYYKEAVGAFIVFDVTRAATFEAVKKWKQDLDSKVQLADGSHIPCMLLANKCDQEKQGICAEKEKMDEYVKENKFVGWYETSAKDNINIEESARSLVRQILVNDKRISADTVDGERFVLTNSAAPASKKCAC